MKYIIKAHNPKCDFIIVDSGRFECSHCGMSTNVPESKETKKAYIIKCGPTRSISNQMMSDIDKLNDIGVDIVFVTDNQIRFEFNDEEVSLHSGSSNGVVRSERTVSEFLKQLK